MNRWIATILLLFLPNVIYADAGDQVFINGTIDNPSNSGNEFVSIFTNSGGWQPDNNKNETKFSSAGTINTLRVELETAPGAGKSWTFTVDYADNLTCTISDSATTCEDTVNSNSISAADVARIGAFPTSTPATGDLWYSISWTPTTENEMHLGGSLQFSIDNTVTNYAVLSGGNDTSRFSGGEYSLTETDVQMVVPTSGTISNLQVSCEASPGSGNTWTMVVRKNASDTAITCNWAGGGTSCSDTSNSVSVSDGDLINLAQIPDSEPTNRHCEVSVRFVPDTSGYFIIPTALDGDLSTSTQYHVGGYSVPQTTEANAKMLSNAFTAKEIQVKLVTAPGAGTSRTFTLRLNETTDTALNCTISDTATTCTQTSDVEISANDIVNIKSTLSGSPAASRAAISLIGEVAEADGGGGGGGATSQIIMVF